MEDTELETKLTDILDLELVSWKSVPKRLKELMLLKSKLRTLDEKYQFKEFSRLIKALNHPVRIQVLIALNEGVTCACELEYLTGLAQATISHHLSLLEDAKIISRKREGKRSFFSIKNQEIVDSFINF